MYFIASLNTSKQITNEILKHFYRIISIIISICRLFKNV